MSALGQKQTFEGALPMSALPPIADILVRRDSHTVLRKRPAFAGRFCHWGVLAVPRRPAEKRHGISSPCSNRNSAFAALPARSASETNTKLRHKDQSTEDAQ